MNTRGFSALSVLAVVAGSAASAHAFQPMTADTSGFHTLSGGFIPATPTLRNPSGTTYNVYTGVTNAAGNLFLLESTAAPARDDVVTFDNTTELINDYVAAAGGTQRSVMEMVTDNGDGTYTISIWVRGTNPTTGAPATLFPGGFTGGGQPLTGAGFGIGLGLPASVGGADPLDWNPLDGNSVIAASLSFTTNDVVTAGPFNIGGFFPVYPAPWNGVLGLSLGGGAGQGFTDVHLDLLVEKIPAPGSFALLGLGGLVAIRRRR